MNDVADGLFTVLNNETGAGERLVSLASSIHRDGSDFIDSRNRARLRFPCLLMHVGAAEPLDLMRGSRWQIYRAEIVLELVVKPAANPTDDAWETAREACETLSQHVERVLMSNRFRANTWSDLQYDSTDSGGRGKFDTVEVWHKRIPVQIRFARRLVA